MSDDPVTRKLVQHATDKTLTQEDVELAKVTIFDSTPIRVVRNCLAEDPNDIASDVLQADTFDKSIQPPAPVAPSPSPAPRKYRGHAKGQTMVEFALLLILFVAIAFGAAALWGWITQQPDFQKAVNSMAVQAGATTTTQIQQNEHSLKHIEAADIVQACNRDGPYQTWKDKKEAHKYYFICKLYEGRAYGIIVAVVEGAGNVAMKTAFTPGDGAFNTVRQYLEQSATRYSGAIK